MQLHTLDVLFVQLLVSSIINDSGRFGQLSAIDQFEINS